LVEPECYEALRAPFNGDATKCDTAGPDAVTGDEA
jgi:hypothetical protein